jgi:LacI family repressor for deo operon, udp, cdd, tsx, nupC, and nupG
MNSFFVGVDNKAGAYMGTQHLIGCGYRKIGILAGLERLSTMRERLDGYCQALQAAGIGVNQQWIVPSQLTVEGGRQAMKSMLNLADKPEAVFINNNLLALGALLEMGERNPDFTKNLGIVCFDDHPWSEVSNPPLTVVRQPTQKMGQIAAEMILALINDRPVPQKRVILDCALVVRRSCQSLPT